VKALPLQGPVLTDFHLACYLIYETYPRYPVYIDSRFDMGGRDHLGSYFELMLHPERELPALQEKYEFELAILRPGTFPSLPLLVHLLHQPLWIPIHEDNEAVVLLRRCEANREVLASLSDLPDGEVLRRRYAGMLGDLSRGPGGG
jgi:hypothetical protein